MTENLSEIERIREVYSTVYKYDSRDRRRTWNPRNIVSVYYRHARERALIALFNDYDIALEDARILDVGCGSGGILRFLISLGASPENLCGLDLMPYRIEKARSISPPQIDWRVGNAEALPYPSQTFDVVSQFTVFSSILDEQVRMRVAREMMRVLKPRGYILWYDMRHTKSDVTRGVEVSEIRWLFPSCALLSLRKLHPVRAARVLNISWLLCELWERAPLVKKTHYLALLQSNGGL